MAEFSEGVSGVDDDPTVGTSGDAGVSETDDDEPEFDDPDAPDPTAGTSGDAGGDPMGEDDDDDDLDGTVTRPDDDDEPTGTQTQPQQTEPTPEETTPEEEEADLPDPSAEDSPAGSVVTGAEAERLVRRAREEEVTLRELENRPALAAQLERQVFGGADPRTIAAEAGGRDVTNVNLTPGGRLQAKVDRSAVREQVASEREDIERDEVLFNRVTDGIRVTAIDRDDPSLVSTDRMFREGRVRGRRQMRGSRDVGGTDVLFSTLAGRGVAVDSPLRQTDSPAPSVSEFAETEIAGIRPTADQQLRSGTQPDRDVASQVSPIVSTEVAGFRPSFEVVEATESDRRELTDAQRTTRPFEGAPTQGAVSDYLQDQTGLPSRSEMLTGINDAFEDTVGVRPAEEFEQARLGAKRTVTSAVDYAVQNPLRTGAAVAAAPVAAAEPTPVGEGAIFALLAGGTVAAGAAASQNEIEVPSQPPEEQSELGTAEGDQFVTEIEVGPEQQTISPAELGLPDDAFQGQQGEVPVDVSGGGSITEDGEISIPIGTTAVAAEERYEEEEEEEEEDEEEDEEEEEEERVVVEVPSEMIPEETVTLGGEGGEAEAEGEESTGEAEALPEVGVAQESDEGEDDAEADEEFEDERALFREGQQSDAADPDGLVSDEVDPSGIVDDQPAVGGLRGAFILPTATEGTLGAGGGVTPFPPLLGTDEQQAQTTVVGTGVGALDLVGQAEAQAVSAAQAAGALDAQAATPAQAPLQQPMQLNQLSSQNLGQNLTQNQPLQAEEYALPELVVERFQYPAPGLPGSPSQQNVRQPREDEIAAAQAPGVRSPISESGAGDSPLAPGWLSQTFGTIATMGTGGGEAPTQGQLADQPAGLRATGELPSAVFFAEDEETQEGLEETVDLLSFGEVDL